MVLQLLKLLVVSLAVRAEIDALLEDDCFGEECQVELRQLRGIRVQGQQEPDTEEPKAPPTAPAATPAPATAPAAPATAPAAPATAPADAPAAAAAKTTCTSLENHGSFSSAKVGIGTPPQYFELVADTGSDNVIVQSCICKESHHCPMDFGKCFRGTGRSSTFHINIERNERGEEGMSGFVMSFGSGDIMVVKSSDEVEVGTAKAFMNESLLLMVKQDLSIRGQFEGILGLGRPHRGEASEKKVPGFMKLAGIERFSMCFNDVGPGVLGLNEAPAKESLQSVGSVHWGLDFRGVTVGDDSESLNFCKEKKPGMQTACGLIPDSGTTLITGPKDDIEKLYHGICLKWPRCRRMQEALQEQLNSGRMGALPRDIVVGRMAAMLQAGSTHAPFDYPEPDYLEHGPSGAYKKELPYTESPDYVETGPDGVMRKDLDDGPDGDGFEEPGLPYEGPGPAEYPGPGSVEYSPDMGAGPDGPEDPEAEWGPGFGGEDEPLEGPPGPDDADPDVVVEIPDAAGVPDDQIVPDEATEPSDEVPVEDGDDGTTLPETVSMASTFVLLMKHCYTWLGNSTDLDTEMPTLSFQVAGTAGGQETLTLDANSYTFLTTVPVYHKEVEYFLGYLPVEIVTVRNEQVCLPAFSSMNYTTQQNGPVWIMGTPLFYSYKVQYDREPEPPTMSFSQGCGTCHDGVDVPATKSAQFLQQSSGIGRLRKLNTAPVVKRIDPASPL